MQIVKFNISCTICNKEFKHRKSLFRHERAVHRNKVHKCTICNTSFNRLDNLNSHAKSHEEKSLKSKFALIPEELVAKHTVSSKRLSELDKIMISILNSNLPDHEKLIRYHEVLQKSLNLQEFNTPTYEKKDLSEKKDTPQHTLQDISKDPKNETEKKPLQVNYQDLILPSIPKNMRGKAENVLGLIKNQPDILSWNSKGQLVVNKEEIPHSNIIDFFSHLYKPKNNISNADVYNKVLEDLNIPMQFIGNAKTSKKKTVPKRKPGKRPVKPPIKWESY